MQFYGILGSVYSEMGGFQPRRKSVSGIWGRTMSREGINKELLAMKFTLIGGVKKAKKLVRSLKTKTRRKKFVTLVKIISVIIILGLFPLYQVYAFSDEPEINNKNYQSEIVLSVENNSPLEIKNNISEIKLGESTSDQKKREEKEALALEVNTRSVVSRDTTVDRYIISEDPSLEQKRVLAQEAAGAYGIDWKILEAVWQVESGKRYVTSVTSYAGACGPMQFMPSTWAAYGQDGNGDGVADVYNAEDALYGAANYLAANGAASGDVYRALFAYNHADWYVQKVLGVANSI